MTGRSRTVVVVDDDHDHALIIAMILRDMAAVTVRLCSDLAQLPTIVAGAAEDTLLLVDRRLGAVESFAAVAEIHRRRPGLTLVMLSAALTDGDRARALAAGAQMAVEKPASLAGWRALLDGLLLAPLPAPTRDDRAA